MEILAADIGMYWSQYIWPFMMFLIGLSLVVFVHEFGHFLAAKWAGVMVQEFALGFGKKILGFRRGDTLYRLNAFPLGGYVKMLGQEDFNPGATAEHDPRSWQRAPAGKKIVILSAGVTMNIIFSILVFVIVYMAGMRFVAPVVGSVQQGFPAATVILPDEVSESMRDDKSVELREGDRILEINEKVPMSMRAADKYVGLREGDRILEINGKEVRRFNQIRMAAILSDYGETFDLTVSRMIKDQEVRFNVTLEPKEVTSGTLFDKYGTYYAFGIAPIADNVIGKAGKEGYAGDEKFQNSDKIIEVAGMPIENYRDITLASRSAAGKEVEFVVEREGQKVHVKVKPMEITGRTGGNDKEILSILGMSPRIQVAGVSKDSPAEKAGLKIGDVILSYADKIGPSRAELLELNKKFADTEASISVLRDGEVLDLKITPTKRDDAVLIGIVPWPEQDKLFIASVHPGSPAAGAGVAKGVVITKINDTPVATWPQVYSALLSSVDKKVVLTYIAAGSKQKGGIEVLTNKLFDPEKYSFATPTIDAMSYLKTEPIRGNPLEALAWGTEDTVAWMATVYKSLRNIFKGRATTKGFSGPVGISVIAVAEGRKGALDLAYFMAMLSALVAVFNFLPLPVLDGGHVVITLVEKVRGRPIPSKVMIGIQLTGWVLIGGLFLAVTFQDIARHFFGQ